MGAQNSIFLTQISLFKVFLQAKISLNMKMKTLQQLKKKQDQLSHHLHEVGTSKKEEDEEVHLQEPHFIEGSLNMNENKIQEALSILHDTQSLVSNSCWRSTSLEDPSFPEDREKIQRAMCNIKGNFMSLLFNRKNVINLI